MTLCIIDVVRRAYIKNKMPKFMKKCEDNGRKNEKF